MASIGQPCLSLVGTLSSTACAVSNGELHDRSFGHLIIEAHSATSSRRVTEFEEFPFPHLMEHQKASRHLGVTPGMQGLDLH